jgi:hypothetical protein
LEIGLWWVADVYWRGGERPFFLLAQQKHQFNIIVSIKISPLFFVRRWWTIQTKGRGRLMRRRVAVGQVADDAMLEKGQLEVSSFLVLVKWQFDNDMNENSPSNCSRR